MNSRSYLEMSQFETFEQRFDYLALHGVVGRETFAHSRWMNQNFYTSREWKQVRQKVIARDNACDLGADDYPIYSKLVIHHIIPMVPEDFEYGNPLILDLNNLITTTHNTHNAIHYGDKNLLSLPFVERRPGDTKSW